MASMSEAIRAAKSHIHLETYIFEQDHVGESFATLLKEGRQRAGVQVRVIYDAVGTLGTLSNSLKKCAPRAFNCWHSTPRTHLG
ncbi:MAG: hypothetical protein IPJ18_14120 [Betaproteobacteria bacterium]|nr:hypothetical protein [Betaproteobacteria bacterium]